MSFGSFQSGIHRARSSAVPAALTLTTSFKDPYADTFDESGRAVHLRLPRRRDRPAGQSSAARRVRAADAAGVLPRRSRRASTSWSRRCSSPPTIPGARTVVLEPGLPVQDMQPGGLVSAPDVRAYATREARVRLHQQRFKLDVMRAYRHRCAICALRERSLVQAAHIVPDVEPEGIAAVVNGLALCAIHHLAFDRNLLGIDPDGVVHIARRLLRETDGPMLRTGLQGFHGDRIALPRRPQDRPDPQRLEVRFERFERASA